MPKRARRQPPPTDPVTLRDARAQEATRATEDARRIDALSPDEVRREGEALLR